MRPLTRKTLRDIRRHRAQFSAVTLTIFLGVAMFAASYDSFQNLQASYEKTATDFRFANLTVSGGDVVDFAAVASTRPGVETVATRTVLDLPVEIGDHRMLGRLVGIPVGNQPGVNQLKLLRGADLDQTLDVLVEEHMADHFDLGPGDALAVLGPEGWLEITVKGVVSSPEYIWPARDRQDLLTSPDNFGVVFGSEELARRLNGSNPNEATIYYQGGAENEELSAELTVAAIGAGAIKVYTRAEQASNLALTEDLRGFEELAAFFPMLFLAAGAMAAYVMISRMVHSQQAHIGVLLANGFTRAQVMRHYLSYGLVPGLAGAIPGAVVGALLARVITSLYTNMLSIPVTLIEFHPATLAGGIGIGLLAALAAAGAPALTAGRLAPAEAMRGEVKPGRGKPSIPERMVPALQRLPIRWRMVLRGIERNPRRTTYTITGVVLSMILVLVSWGMMDTVIHLFDLQFEEIQQEDATIYFAGPVDIDRVADLEAVPGLARAEPVLQFPVAVAAGGHRYETAFMALEAGTSMRRFPTEDGGWMTLPEEGILVGAALRQQLGVAVGDRVSLTFAGADRAPESTIAGFVDEPLGTIVYASWAQTEQLAGSAQPASAALIQYEDGTDADAMRASLAGRPDVAAFEDTKALYGVIKEYMVLFYAFVGVMLAFGAAMAFALIFNTMSVNIAERSREAATLLAVGTDRRSISRMIAAENLLVVLGAIPVGLVAGYYVSMAAMASFESDMFAFDLYIRPTTFLWSSLAMVVVALISQWPGLRAVRRLHIPTIVKERST